MENSGRRPFPLTDHHRGDSYGAAYVTEPSHRGHRREQLDEEEDNWRSHYQHGSGHKGRNGFTTASTTTRMQRQDSERLFEPRQKESVREAFLRQVRDVSLQESNATTTTWADVEYQGDTSSQPRVFTNKRGANPRIEDAPTRFVPEMSSDSEVPVVTNGKLGKINAIKPESRRDTLLDQFSNCTYECMVCCAKVYHRQSIWNCQSCHNAFHLHCIKKWSASSAIRMF